MYELSATLMCVLQYPYVCVVCNIDVLVETFTLQFTCVVCNIGLCVCVATFTCAFCNIDVHVAHDDDHDKLLLQHERLNTYTKWNIFDSKCTQFGGIVTHASHGPYRVRVIEIFLAKYFDVAFSV
jgi:hypothetical protein